MSKECIKVIKAAARSGSVSDEQAKNLMATLQHKASLRRERKGITREAALKEIAGELEATIGRADLSRKRNVLLSEAAIRQRLGWVEKQKNKGLAIQQVLSNIDNAAHRNAKRYLGKLEAELKKEDAWDAFHKGDADTGRDYTIEMWRLQDPESKIPSTGNKDAITIAKVFHALNNELTHLKNVHGADIAQVKGWALPQKWDQGKLRKLAKNGMFSQPDMHAAKQAFWDAYEQNGVNLDWERIIDPINGSTPESFKSHFFENVYNRRFGPMSASMDVEKFSTHGSLANKLSARRVLWFKDPLSEWKARELFGEDNWSIQMVDYIQDSARQIEILKGLGPNPESNLSILRKRTINGVSEAKDSKQQIDGVNASIIDKMFSNLTGEASHSRRPMLSKAIDNIKALQVLGKLGGAMLSSITDAANFQSAMVRQGIPALERFQAQVDALIPRSGERLRVAKDLGFFAESGIHSMAGRYMNDFSPWRWVRSSVDSMFKYTGLTGWTRGHESQMADVLAMRMGAESNMRWSDLPELRRRNLEISEIDEVDWDFLRGRSEKLYGDSLGITPDMAKYAPDSAVDAALRAKGLKLTPANRSRYRAGVESRLGGYFEEAIYEAVPRPGLKEKAILNQGIQRGNIPREVLDLLTLFKSFPVTVMTRAMKRHKMSGDVLPRLWFGNFLMQATFLGLVANWTKDIANGRTPKRLVKDGELNIKVFVAAFTRGGGAGILGDFLLNEYDRTLNNPATVVMGPAIGDIFELGTIASQAVRGETGGLPSRALRVAKGNTPYASVWYIKPLADYFFWWNIQESIDPGRISRMERRVKKDGIQEFFIDPSKMSRIPMSKPGDKLRMLMGESSKIPSKIVESQSQ